MKVATWNLSGPRMSRPRAKRLRDHLLDPALDADILVLTETHPDVTLEPEYRMVSASAPAPDRANGERWVEIWVRANLGAQDLWDYTSERTACVRLSSPPNLLVYGTVLPWHGDSRHGARGLAAFAAALKLQQDDWTELRATKPPVPLIVAGDFNQDLLTDGHYYGSDKRRDLLKSTLSSIGLSCETGDVLVAGHACIDHICVSPGITVGDEKPQTFAEERATSVSDHFGVALPFALA